MLKKIISIAKSKKEWKKPAQNKCLIFDARTGKPLHCLIDHKNIHELFLPSEKLNMFVLFKCLLQKRISNLCYCENYVRAVNPRVVITMSDNNVDFYKLKNLLPKVTFLAIQSSWRGEGGDLFEKKILQGLSCDYYFAFNRAIGSLIKRNIKCKVIVAGSLLNNELTEKNHKQGDKRKLVFISEFRKKRGKLSFPCKKYNGVSATWEELYSLEKRLLPILHTFCQKNRIELLILGAKPVDYSQEHDFFKKCLPKYGWNFNSRTNWFSSYEAINSADFVVYINSTLGYEAFGAGKPVASISARGHWFADFHDRKFGWPNKFPSQGLCWTNDYNEKTIKRVLKNLISEPNQRMKQQLQAVRAKVMQYDAGNSKLKALLHQKGITTESALNRLVTYQASVN